MALNIFSRYLGGTPVGGTRGLSRVKTGSASPGEKDIPKKSFNPTLFGADLSPSPHTGSRISFYEPNDSIEVAGLTAEATVEYGEYSTIDKITLVFNMPGMTYTEEDKQNIIQRVKDCPVSRSLRDDMQKEYIFNWPK